MFFTSNLVFRRVLGYIEITTKIENIDLDISLIILAKHSVWVMRSHNQLLSYMVSRHFISPNRWPIRCYDWLLHVHATVVSLSCLCNNHNSAL